jgi:hypothetical protein
MRDSLPTIRDIREIYFKSQRKKNIIPRHANLTPKYNRSISRLISELDEAGTAGESEVISQDLDRLLQTKRAYEDELFEKLRDSLEARILLPPSRIRLRRKKVDGREVTSFNKARPTLMLLDRFAGLQLSRAFRLRPQGRDQRLRALINTLQISANAQHARQGIIRTDIKTFYDQIDHAILLSKIDGHAGVPRHVKSHVRAILEAYARVHGHDFGIPQGVPSSAVLAEIYLEDLDTALQRDLDVALYVRYVDDIVVVCAPDSVPSIERKLEAQLTKVRLSKNISKSKTLVHPCAPKTEFQYLGYKFIFAEVTSKLATVDISDSKSDRYLRALSKISAFRVATSCWATVGNMRIYLLLFEYLLRPHATSNSGPGVRIVTGLAYSARFISGKPRDRGNLVRVLNAAKREVSLLRNSLIVLPTMPTSPVCACCMRPVALWEQLEDLISTVGQQDKAIRSPATPHADDATRERIRGILWS